MTDYFIYDGYVLSRMILFVFFAVHMVFAVIGTHARIHIPSKLFHGFFALEFAALTAFVVLCCIKEPFDAGIIWALIGYGLVYFSLFTCWFLSAHVTISREKVYEMRPFLKNELEKKKCVLGHIREGGANYTVIIFDDELYEKIKDGTPLKVRFKAYPPRRPNYIPPYEVEMQQVRE